MKPVRRSTERSFLKGLKGMFQGFVNRLKTGAAGPSNIWQEVGSYIRQLSASKRPEKVVTGMIKEQRDKTARDWREAVLKNTYGPEMYQAIQREMKGPVGKRVIELIAENAKYIKTVPEEWAAYITAYTERETRKGKRPEEIEAELRKIMPAKIAKNLKTIARTECAKANAALTQARAENLGIQAYIWHSVHDERTRPAHASMDGILVFYDDPPAPESLFPSKGGGGGHYHAGNTYNCRCYQEPVVNIRTLPDVIRVYRAGSVRSMTKKQIKRQFGKIAG